MLFRYKLLTTNKRIICYIRACFMANNLVHMLVQLYRLFTEETNACILEEQSSIFYAGFSSFILLVKTLWGNVLCSFSP